MSEETTLQVRKALRQNGRRIKTVYIASIADLESDAKGTPAAAKADLLEKIAAGFRGWDYDPILLPIPEGHIVVSRSPFSGWTYHFDRGGQKSGWCLLPVNEAADKAAVLAYAKRHADTLNEDARTTTAEVLGVVP